MSLIAELGLRPVNRSLVARAIRWYAATRFGAWSLSGTLPQLDRWALRVTGGRATFSDRLGGVPTIFLTTVGARSGQPRTVQLIVVAEGEDLAVIGSNFGRAAHPAWVTNLLAEPRATAVHGRRSIPVTAREVSGTEAERIWAAAPAVHPGFGTYPVMAAGRQIRVFRLTAAPDPAHPV